jgi:hypothetical protein
MSNIVFRPPFPVDNLVTSTLRQELRLCGMKETTRKSLARAVTLGTVVNAHVGPKMFLSGIASALGIKEPIYQRTTVCFESSRFEEWNKDGTMQPLLDASNAFLRIKKALNTGPGRIMDDAVYLSAWHKPRLTLVGIAASKQPRLALAKFLREHTDYFDDMKKIAEAILTSDVIVVETEHAKQR